MVSCCSIISKYLLLFLEPSFWLFSHLFYNYLQYSSNDIVHSQYDHTFSFSNYHSKLRSSFPPFLFSRTDSMRAAYVIFCWVFHNLNLCTGSSSYEDMVKGYVCLYKIWFGGFTPNFCYRLYLGFDDITDTHAHRTRWSGRREDKLPNKPLGC